MPGATIDHALYSPDGTGSLERGYVALSRGRDTNRIYATADTGWRDALATPGAHTLALQQHPDPAHPTVQRLLGVTPDTVALRQAAAEAAAIAIGRQARMQRSDAGSPNAVEAELR